MSRVVMSGAWGPVARRLARRVAPVQAEWAEACGYDAYELHAPEDGGGSIMDSWRKVGLLLAALERGASEAVWLDIDVVPLLPEDVPSPEPGELHAWSEHPASSEGPCCGVWRARSGGESFLRVVDAQPRDERDILVEQTAVKRLLEHGWLEREHVLWPVRFGAMDDRVAAPVLRHLAGMPWRVREAWLDAHGY